MVRFISIVIGAGFCFVLAIALVFTTYGETAEHEFHLPPKELHLASDGPLGKFDRQQLQRGFQVFKEVCAACHSLHQVAFRDLQQIGYNEAEVKAIATQWAIQVPSVNPETGEAATRAATPADKFPSPFANDVAARAANNTAIPPDLSLMAKARHDGPAYVYSLLTGYSGQPAEQLRKFPESKTPAGLHYNRYFPNLNLAMIPPLTAEGQVTYADGTKASVDQMSKDVSAFLVWTAEPNLEARHTIGWAAIIFLGIFIVLAIGAYRNVWRNVKH